MNNYLYHYGVLGMKWGVRKRPAELAQSSRKERRQAKRDAKEYVRAKMFYGEGAGNRRKFIKGRVDQRSKNAGYKRAFDYYAEQQDKVAAIRRAKVQRRTKDALSTSMNFVLGTALGTAIASAGATAVSNHIRRRGGTGAVANSIKNTVQSQARQLKNKVVRK